MAKNTSKNKGGRPTKFTKAIANEICYRIAAGESLRCILRDNHLPSLSTVMRWLLDNEYKEFWEQYAKARELQAEVLFDETLDIADDASNDFMHRENDDGEEYALTNYENIQRSRLRIDTRKWYCSKVLPKKYGEKVDVTSGGERLTLADIVRDDGDE